MTDIPLPSPGDTSWSDWGADEEAASDKFANHTYGALNVRDYGAVGDGTTDDSVAFATAAAAAKALLTAAPASATYTDTLGTVTISVPPGKYKITTAGAFLGNEGMTAKGVGLRWLGAGKTTSTIIYQPATASIMASNDYWQGLEFIDLGFRAATTGCTFLKTTTTHAAQRYLFRSCFFEKFKYGVVLEGDNNNSEYLFFDCHTLSHQNDGAFFYVGATNTVDQFLNYWFYGCTHWGTSAPFIDASRGGHFHIYGLDVSAFGQSLAATGYVFALRGVSHSLGVCNVTVDGLRVEAMNANAALLYSEWPQGNIAMRGVDWSSQSASYIYGDIIKVAPANTNGAALTVTDSQLAGGVRVVMATNSYAYKSTMVFRDCTWLQRNTPTDVVSYDTSVTGGNTLPFPPVEFINCRGANTDPTLTTGAAVWDARVGYRGQLVQDLKPRALSVRGTYGTPASGTTLTFTLPLGALITGLRALSPVGGGGVTEGDGGSWTLATTEGTPTTVATATVATALTSGYDVTAAVSPPFHCSTAAKAKLTISATNVSQWNFDALLLVTGYW